MICQEEVITTKTEARAGAPVIRVTSLLGSRKKQENQTPTKMQDRVSLPNLSPKKAINQLTEIPAWTGTSHSKEAKTSVLSCPPLVDGFVF
jgi:hypothetical protein